jgi:hypothetical protein
MNHYQDLASIDVSKFVEKKGRMDYLSWPIAVDFLMKKDPQATWQFHEPQLFGETMMVACTVTAFNKGISMHLPVMDNTNKAIKNPDSFAVNKAMMRCLVKAIACHGLGIKVYAGEDLPEEVPMQNDLENDLNAIKGAKNEDELKKVYSLAVTTHKSNRGNLEAIVKAKDIRKGELGRDRSKPTSGNAPASDAIPPGVA